jgi:hypothetical protein
MKSRYFLLFPILCCFVPGFGQNYRPSPVKAYLSLTGEVNLLTFFINTAYDYWDEEEVDFYYEELLESQKWLEWQADIWGQELEFNNDAFLGDNKSTVYLEKVLRGSNPESTIGKIMKEIGFKGLDDFLEYYQFDLDTRKLKIVLFVKSNNRSHAYNRWSVKEMDLAVIYCRNTIGMITGSTVIAHEILHQFGAWDLYYELGRSQTRETSDIIREKYPNSIMRRTSGNENTLEVDEVTAWRIGWGAFQKEFRRYDPVVNSKERVKEYQDYQWARRKSLIHFNLKKEKKEQKN